MRGSAPGNLNFDNVTFFLNAMDTLVGDESFVALRNRRVRHRTLARVENQTRNFIERRAQEEAEAEPEADANLAAAQSRLDAEGRRSPETARISTRRRSKIMARNLEEVENRRLEVQKTNIDTAKEAAIRASEERMETQIRLIQSSIRSAARLVATDSRVPSRGPTSSSDGKSVNEKAPFKPTAT